MPERKQGEKTRQRVEEEHPERKDKGTGTGGGAPATEAQEVVHQSVEVAVEAARAAGAHRSAMGPLGALGPLGAVEASPADITDELEKGGPAFGSFVKAVGLAVADAQAKLDETLVTTAKALSDTQIDVIAVFEQEINDDGEMSTGTVHKQKLPLVNYLMPTAYKWSRVYLQSDMRVKEFNGANGFNIQGKSSSFTAGAQASYGLFGGFSVGGSTRFSTNSYQYGGETSFAQDEAAGDLHMEATLEPRDDIQLPRPFVLQKGPRLKVTAGARTDIMDSASPPQPIGRQITLTAELKNKSNNALPNKQLEFRISQPLLNYTLTNNGVTDANGKVDITIKREGGAFDKNKPPEPVLVNVWLGLVNEQVAINI